MRNRILAIAGTTLATALIATTQASALYVRPFKAPLQDASGASNGCEIKIADMLATPYGNVRANIRLTCPAAANVVRTTYTWGVQEVMPDGSLREVDPYAPKARNGYLTPLDGVERWTIQVAQCKTPADVGTHTWLIRARVNVKQTLDTTDPNPFYAKVDRLQTVTC